MRAGCDFFFEPADEAGGSGAGAKSATRSTCRCRALAAPAQLRNAAAAIAALRALDVDVPDEALRRRRRQGARCRAGCSGSSATASQIVVDVGHNPQAARELAAWLNAAPAAGRTLAVFAALGDKDVAGVVDGAGGVDRRTGTWPGWPSTPRAACDVAAFAERLVGTAAATR